MATPPVAAAAPRSTHRSSNAGARHPIKVIIVDVERCPAEISALHPDGGRYHGLWVLARSSGQPRALIKLRLEGDRVSGAELSEYFRGPEFGPRPQTTAVPEPEPLISIVVCTTFERQRELENCLRSISELDYPSFEVFVIDNRKGRCDRDSVEWVERFSGVRLVREPQPGQSAARNCGLQLAQGEIVAFTDDDVLIDPGWLRAIARRFAAHPEEAGMAGLIMPAELETEAQLRFEQYYGGFGPRIMQPVSHVLKRGAGLWIFRKARVCEVTATGEIAAVKSLYDLGCMGIGANMAFRTEPLRAIGGFDVRLSPGTPAHGSEDNVLFIGLLWRGHRAGFEPAALVSHVHRRNDAELRRQVSNWGVAYTAALLALARDDPRHLAAMLAGLARGIVVRGRWFAKRLPPKPGQRAAATSGSSISSLARVELGGMLRGPLGYLRSSRSARAWQIAQGRAPL